MSIVSALLQLGFLLLAQVVAGEEVAWTEAKDELPSWASENTLQLKLSADSTNYAVIPLTDQLALGESGKESGVCCTTIRY